MKIYIIITTSINNRFGIIDEEHRQNRYIESIENLLHLLKNDNYIKPIIVENNGKRQTFLDYIGCDVFYTNNNSFNFSHKGVNELLDLKDVINHYNINDDDIIIKLTGRYKLLSLSFIDKIKENYLIYDAFVKCFNVCTLKYDKNDCVLGLFAIKCKYLKDFEYNCIKSPECELIEYINNNLHNKLYNMFKLDLECCFADNLQKLIV
jgi:hypothetical protein